MNEQLDSGEALRKELERATESYIEQRDRLDRLGQSNHPGGGPDRVKCLHAHTAQQLVLGDNPIGRIVLSELGWQDPTDPCV